MAGVNESFQEFAQDQVDLCPAAVRAIENQGSETQRAALHHVERSGAGEGTTTGLDDATNAVACETRHRRGSSGRCAGRAHGDDGPPGTSLGAEGVDLYPKSVRDLENSDSDLLREALHHAENSR